MKNQREMDKMSLNKSDKVRWRLLLVSSRARHVTPMANCLLPGVMMVTYKYESSTLDQILAQVSSALQGKKVEMLAMVLHGTESELQICGPGEKVLSVHSASQQISVREFFKTLVHNHLDKALMKARFDFLAAHPANGQFGPIIASSLQSLLEIPVALSVDLFGTDVDVTRFLSTKSSKVSSGQLYFNTRKLKEGLRNVVQTRKIKTKDLKNYEKIRTVGKGAFGTAVLYRRMEDDILVVIKEINLLELPGTERQMSINEINVLAMMNHPNIVSYLDSFERDSYLCIEMEYADGGSLAQFLQQKIQRLEEKEILMIFHQICSAIRFMHDQNILHRDLKTANIFLTKQGVVKVGDFGISKMLSTQHAQANTVLGTPYYISPEKWEGKPYDEKSDIWALGCILYEMACLQKTFEGSNLPALVNKIMKGQFAPIKGNYSPGFRQLVRDLLQKDPEFRPTAAEILHERLPELLAQFDYSPLGIDEIDEELKLSIEVARQNQIGRPSKPPRSVVYHLKAYESSISLTPVPLPPRIRVKEIAVSTTHIIVLSSECLVYTWGEGKKGQLGNECLENWRTRPAVVESLKEKGITRVCAGDGFSVFASDNGIVMTCGDGSFGCLGHSDWNSNSKPKLIEELLSVDVSAIACGSHHVVVVGGDGEVYSWGKGEGGRLGLGNEEDCCTPTQIESLLDDGVIANVKCGGDGTILLTDQGAMLACGRNTRNKLALNDVNGLFSSKKEVDMALIPTPVKSIGYRVVDVAMGPSHSAVLTETGQVITFGRNSEGQLGRGNCRSSSQPVLVRSMSKKIITMIQCGSTFTVIGTCENALYLWGTRAVSPTTRPNTQEGFTNTWGQRSALGSAVTTDGLDPEFNFDDDSPKHSIKTRRNRDGHQESEGLYSDRKLKGEINLRDVLHTPQEILALYASPSQVAKGEIVSLSSVHCQNQSIFLVVETTAPLPKPGRMKALSQEDKIHASREQTKIKKQSIYPKQNNHFEKEEGHFDTLGPVPEWLKADLDDAILQQPTRPPVSNKNFQNAPMPRKKMANGKSRDMNSRPPRSRPSGSPVEGQLYNIPSVHQRKIGRPPYSKSGKSKQSAVKSPFTPNSPLKKKSTSTPVSQDALSIADKINANRRKSIHNHVNKMEEDDAKKGLEINHL